MSAAVTVLAFGPCTVSRAADADRSSGPELLPFNAAQPHPTEKLPLSEGPLADIDASRGMVSPSESVPTVKPKELSTGGASDSSPLPRPDAGLERSAQLEDVARQADRHSRHGYELAGRGAFFAARSEFLAAMRLVAEGLDAEYQTKSHGHALAIAMTAMKEAEDFLPREQRLEADLDLPRILNSHNTTVLKDHAETATPLVALKCYFTFAQEQFAMAVGHEVAGSMALHGLGKLHAAATSNKSVRIFAPEPKAVVYFQAALLACPKNYMAANDLGVLFARCGNVEGARSMLEYSLAIHEQCAGWKNLSTVYRQLGQTAQASRAAQQAEVVHQAEMARRRGMQLPTQDKVQWLDTATFAQTSTNTPNSPDAVRPSATPSATSPRPSNSPQVSSQVAPTAPAQPAVGWLPWGSQNTRR